MKEIIEAINKEIEVFQKDSMLQLEKNNKAAGVRARKAGMNICKLMKEFKKASLEASK